ncbi:MAG: rhodanese-like domain-containing protein [Gammaproteobacteria bacterium]|nr:rhodanese-like domain-containing protein [Gammaproteobacteria bacterium]MDH5802531.1 rhodanese-like domain-containing protein [Gammaproteobacteria bacterium]
MFFSVKEIDAPQLVQWLEQEDVQVLDVREMREISQGTIENALFMPLATVPMRLQEINKEGTVVVICRSGARSAQACMFLQQNGFDNVHNLRGGVISWSQYSYPMVRPAVA